MSYSYKWLQSYFDTPLPPPSEIENGIIFHSFEVEGVETLNPTTDGQEKIGDTLLEIKILPDRAHDCLCHFGVAGEISAIFNLPKRNNSSDYDDLDLSSYEKSERALTVEIKDAELCRRYIGRMVENIRVGDSPLWLKERLENIGQRSINNIVDATNYVMFDLGQPMHAFDADKVAGNIIVRLASHGEKLTTLDGKQIDLAGNILVIADDVGPLAIAGVKGGNRAEVDQNTKNIILESANFHPANIRRTSASVGIRTDASKRFENELSPEIAGRAMDNLTSLLCKIAAQENLRIGEKIDSYPNPGDKRIIETSISKINSILGISVPEDNIISILRRLDIVVNSEGEKLKLEIPARRMDLEIAENIVEEVGRIYGYDKIPAKLLDADLAQGEEKEAVKRYRVMNKIRETLVKQGFSEVYGYAFVEKGDIELANPLANNKPFLRTNLSTWLKERLAFNLQHVLFDTEPVKIFELGRVFKKENNQIREITSFVFGVARKGVKQKIGEAVNRELMSAKDALCQELKMTTCPASDTLVQTDESGNFSYAQIETSFDDLVGLTGKFVEPNLQSFISPADEYKKVSAYPRIIRDIALFVPETVDPSEVSGVIKETAGLLLAQDPTLFDVFIKDGKKSLAFRLVFQSYEKTLSDEEVNGVMNQVISVVKEMGWEVR